MKESTHTPHPLARWIERHSTPADFAREVGCTRSHLYNIIHRRRLPSYGLAERIVEKTKGRVSFAAFRTLEAAE